MEREKLISQLKAKGWKKMTGNDTQELYISSDNQTLLKVPIRPKIVGKVLEFIKRVAKLS